MKLKKEWEEQLAGRGKEKLKVGKNIYGEWGVIFGKMH